MRRQGLVLASVVLVSLSAVPAAWGAHGNPDLDRTFSSDGVASLKLAGLDEWFHGVVAAPSGRVYGVGEAWNKSSDQGLVAAYDSRGRLDHTFSGDGYMLTKGVRGDHWLEEGVALPSGELLVAGQSQHKAFVLRLRANGRMDRSFAGGYRFLPQPDIAMGYVQVAVDSAGNAFVATDNVVSKSPYRAGVVVTKLNVSGGIVRSFGSGGQVHLRVAKGLEVTGLSVDSQDRPIVLASISNRRGDATSKAALIRLTSAGRRDAAFNGSGLAEFRLPSGAPIWPVGLDVTSTDDIVVGSKSPASASTRFNVHRFLSSGLPDPSYSANGVATVRTGLRVASYAGTGTLLPDGSYTFATGALNRRDWLVKAVLLRVSPAGALDRTFGRDGLFIPNVVEGPEILQRSALDANGRLLVAGGGSREALIARLTLTY